MFMTDHSNKSDIFDSSMETLIIKSILFSLLILGVGCRPDSVVTYDNQMPASAVRAQIEIQFDNFYETENSFSYAAAIVPISINRVVYCDVENSQDCDRETTTGQEMKLLNTAENKKVFKSTQKIDLKNPRRFYFLAFDGNKDQVVAYLAINTLARNAPEIERKPNIQAQQAVEPSPQSVDTRGNIQPRKTGLADILSGLFGSFGAGSGAANGAGAAQNSGGNTTNNGTGGAQPQPQPTNLSDNELVPNPNNVPISASEFEVIKLTNQARVDKGKKPLVVQQAIMLTSREQSNIMQSRGALRHGFTSGWRAENIGMGYSSPAAAVRGWINSPGHYRNIMGNHTYIGVGDTSQRARAYWTQQFN